MFKLFHRFFVSQYSAMRPAVLKAFVLLLALFSTALQAQDLNQYRLGSGDLINISIYGEPDLSLQTVLTDTGTINYPFIGSIKVQGLTVAELQATIIKGLKPDYLINPEVHVDIKAYRRFYIYGEVTRPGGYEFQPGLTLRKAIALASGLTPRASKTKMFLISDQQETKEEVLIKLDDAIQPGDIINIKQSFF